MSECLIGLGCNQGNCHSAFEVVCQRLQQASGTSLLAVSPAIRTRPIGMPGRRAGSQSYFLNAAAVVQTRRSPQELMQLLLELESLVGRDRQATRDRSIDLDLLLFGEDVIDGAIDQSRLRIPHPRMSFRRFVLEPAVGIAPDMLHPQCNMTIQQLLKHIETQPDVLTLLCENTPLASELLQRVAARLPEINLRAEVRSLDSPTSSHRQSGCWHLQAAHQASLITPDTKLLVCNSFLDGLGGERSGGVAGEYRGPFLQLGISDEDAESQILAAIEATLPIQSEMAP